MAPGISRARSCEEMPMSFWLPCGVNFRQHRHIRQLQLLHELGKQRLGAGVGVGLEGADDPLIAHGAGGGQQGMELTGMVGVVVVDLRPMICPLVLHAAACAVEGLQPTGYRLAGQTQHIRCRRPLPAC